MNSGQSRFRHVAEIVGPFVLAAIVGVILAWRHWAATDILVFTSILTVLTYVSILLYEIQHGVPAALDASAVASRDHLDQALDDRLFGEIIVDAADIRPTVSAIVHHMVRLSSARHESLGYESERFLAEELYEIGYRAVRKLEMQLEGMIASPRIVVHQNEALSYELLERLVMWAECELHGITDWSSSDGPGSRDEVANWWRRNSEPFLAAQRTALRRGCEVSRVFIAPDGFCARPETDGELRSLINRHIECELKTYLMPESQKAAFAELLEARGYTLIDTHRPTASVVLYYQQVDNLPDLSPALVLKRRIYDANSVESVGRLYERLVDRSLRCSRPL